MKIRLRFDQTQVAPRFEFSSDGNFQTLNYKLISQMSAHINNYICKCFQTMIKSECTYLLCFTAEEICFSFLCTMVAAGGTKVGKVGMISEKVGKTGMISEKVGKTRMISEKVGKTGMISAARVRDRDLFIRWKIFSRTKSSKI